LTAKSASVVQTLALHLEAWQSAGLRHLTVGQSLVDIGDHGRQVADGVDHVVRARAFEQRVDTRAFAVQFIAAKAR
jgi:hypothetical protein